MRGGGKNLAVFKFMAASALLVCLNNCGQNAPSAPAAAPPPAPSGPPLRFIALGDSYTIGEGVGASERWPALLAAQLRMAGVNAGNPDIIATSGWTTEDLLRAMDLQKPAGPYDLVTLMIGVNNQFRGGSAEAYRKDFAALLKRAIALARGEASRVVVVSIPDWSATPFAKDQDHALIAAAIDNFNAVNLEETKKAGAAYVDVTPASRKAAGEAANFAKDGLHPSAKTYTEWTTLLLPAAQAALGGKKDAQ